MNKDKNTMKRKKDLHQCAIHGLNECQVCKDGWKKSSKITAKNIKYLQEEILKREFTMEEYDDHFQNMLLITARIIGCF